MKYEKKKKILVAGVFGLLFREMLKMQGRKGQQVKNMKKNLKTIKIFPIIIIFT